MSDSPPIELLVEEQPGTECYRVRWRNNEIFIANIPNVWLYLVPYMAALKLWEQGYHVDRLLIVRLRGSDFDLMRARLGFVAAPPLLNTKPVTKPQHPCYWSYPNVDNELIP
jgi:hypothetical protein